MELVNAMYAHKDKAESVNADLANELTHNLVLLLAPFVPHITEELWHELGELHPSILKTGLYTKNLLL